MKRNFKRNLYHGGHQGLCLLLLAEARRDNDLLWRDFCRAYRKPVIDNQSTESLLAIVCWVGNWLYRHHIGGNILLKPISVVAGV